MRRGAGAVGDLADQTVAVVQQAQPDGLGAVPDGVGRQLADDQLGGEGQLVQAPGLQSTGDVSADAGDGRRIGRNVPLGDLAGVQQPGAGDEQSDVVVGALRQQGVEDCLAGLFRGAVGVTGQGVSQEVQAGVEIAMAVLDQPVGEQGQPAALGQLQCGAFEREAAAQAEGW